MKTRLLLFVLAASLVALGQGQGRGGGRGAGAGSGSGSGAGMGGGRPDTTGSRPDTTGKSGDHRGSHDRAGKPESTGQREQKPLSDAQKNSGAFRMLQDKTGMTSDQLQAAYASSGAKNFGQFTSAIIVSRNLGLNETEVMNGLKTKSLGQTLHDMGVEPAKAKQAIRDAERETGNANRGKGKAKGRG